MTCRRQFLGVAAALAALPDLGSPAASDDETDEPASQCRESSQAPLEDCFGTLDLLVHDKTIDVDVIAGGAREAHDGNQAAILRLRMDGGNLAVTLHPEDIDALINALDTTAGAAGTS